MRIAVVEDNTQDREMLLSFIKKYAMKNKVEINIFSFSLGEKFLKEAELTLLDVVFLDIFLEKTNGIEIAKMLRKRKYTGFIIFCTSTADYALQGYSVQAYEYIVKPYTCYEVERTLEAVQCICEKESPTIRIKEGGAWYKEKLSDILYVENRANYVDVYMENKTYSTRMAFKEMEKELDQYNSFVKCDRGVIVNLFHIREMNGNKVVMDNKAQVFVSRGNRAQVNKRYISYIFEEMEK